MFDRLRIKFRLCNDICTRSGLQSEVSFLFPWKLKVKIGESMCAETSLSEASGLEIESLLCVK